MSYTLAEAAAACGINKSTVLRAVKSGRISGAKDDLGTWHVEAAELHRVFPAASASRDAAPHHAPPDSATDALVAELRAVIADLRQDRDEWRNQAQRLALTSPQPPATPVVEEPKPSPKPAERAPRQTFWQWLFESRAA